MEMFYVSTLFDQWPYFRHDQNSMENCTIVVLFQEQNQGFNAQ